MTTRRTGTGCPQLVLDWIAWYPEGELSSSVRGAIEAHAAECSDCRDEIACVSGEAEPAFDATADGSRAFARVLAKVEAAPQRAPAARRPRRHWRVRPTSAIAAGLLVAAFSGTGAVVATQQLGVGFPLLATAAAAFRPSDGDTHLDVVFRPDAPFAEVQFALQEIGASVEAGPTANGVVHLRLASGSDARAAARRLESGDLHIALFAQPTP